MWSGIDRYMGGEKWFPDSSERIVWFGKNQTKNNWGYYASGK